MRNVLLVSTALLVGITMSSCKKDYSCECTKTYTNGTTTVSSKESIRIYKDNKKRATERCNDNESSGTDLGGRYSIDCEIK